MDKIKTVTRIHPLIAAAAVSVSLVSLVGIAAITGLLPPSHGAVDNAAGSAPLTETAAPLAATAPEAQGYADGPSANGRDSAEPHHATHHAHQAAPVQHYAQDTGGRDERAPAAAPAAPGQAKPNYVGIGAGAVIGGLLGNQVGSGRGRTVATIAGALGGGMIGNEVQNRQRKQAESAPQN